MCASSGQEAAKAGCCAREGDLRLTARQVQGYDFTHKGCGSSSI